MRLLPICCFFLIYSSLSLQLISVSLCARPLFAQATTTASKETALSVFGAYSIADADYNAAHNNAFTVGGDITGYLPGGFLPSLEGRVKMSPGDAVSQNTYGGGLRLERRIRLFHPYADVLCSYGSIWYYDQKGIHQHDNSKVYSTGLGLDFDVTSQWSARIDYQYEFWKTGMYESFNPRILSFGVRLPHPLPPLQTPLDQTQKLGHHRLTGHNRF